MGFAISRVLTGISVCALLKKKSTAQACARPILHFYNVRDFDVRVAHTNFEVVKDETCPPLSRLLEVLGEYSGRTRGVLGAYSAEHF